jgi:HEAT repeat protein
VSEFQTAIYMLDSPDAEERRRAVMTLGASGDPRALPVLMSVLRWDEIAVRRQAVWALVELKGHLAYEGLLIALNDVSGYVRAATARALGELRDERAVAPLTQMLRDSDDAARRWAAWALSRLGQAAVPSLLVALRERDHHARRLAARTLGRIGDAAAVPPLTRALRDKNHRVRAMAAEALSDLKDERAVRPLTMALRDKSGEVVLSAARALASIASLHALPALRARVRWWEYESVRVVNAIHEAIAKIEETNRHILRKPIPSTAPDAKRQNLPIPLGDSYVVPEMLPRPAVATTFVSE